MASAQRSPTQQATSANWTEPPWCGWIETTGDALLILEAARQGLIPRVTRRLVDSERKMISSGSVFVFDEDESGIKRWTDGFFWSPSRILGNFLLYRETDKRGAGHRSIKADQALNGETPDCQSRRLDSLLDKTKERSLVGSLVNSYKFKPDGLMKKTFSLSIGGVAQHLISYYKIEDVENGRLRSPSSLPELASLDISPEYLDKTHFRNPPKVEVGADGIPRYRGEADDIDTSTSAHLTEPLSSSNVQPLLTEGRVAETPAASKRGKRYEPYSSPTLVKRPRKNTKSSPPEGNSPPNETCSSPVASATSAVPQPPQPVPTPNGYTESHASMHAPGPVQHGYPYGMGPYYTASAYPPHPPPMHPGVYQAPMSMSTPNPSNGGPSPGHPYPSVYPQYTPAVPGPPSNPMNGAGPSPTAAPQTHGSDPSQAGLGPSTMIPGPQPATPGPSPTAQGPPGHPIYHHQGQPPHYTYYYHAPHPGYPPPGAVSYQWPTYPQPPPAHAQQAAAHTSAPPVVHPPGIQQAPQVTAPEPEGNDKDTNMDTHGTNA